MGINTEYIPCNTLLRFKGTVSYFENYTYSFCCREFVEKIPSSCLCGKHKATANSWLETGGNKIHLPALLSSLIYRDGNRGLVPVENFLQIVQSIGIIFLRAYQIYRCQHAFLTVAHCKTMMSNSCVYSAGNLQGVMAERKKLLRGFNSANVC